MEVTLNDTKLKPLVDSGSQISMITETLARLMGLKVKSLENILEIEGTGEIQVKYRAYVEAILKLPGKEFQRAMSFCSSKR